MKKIISSLLAIAILATTAFAADFTPGEKIRIDSTDAVWGETQPEEELSTSNYSIAGANWSKGKELVSSIKIDNDDNEVVITLKEDYNTAKEKPLIGTIKVRDKKKSRFLEIDVNCMVGYNQGVIDIESDGNIASLIVESDTLYTVVASDDGYPYGTLMFQADSADVSVRVYDDETYFLDYNRQPDRDILIANADSDALIEFLNFEGKPKFTSVATLTFYGFSEDSYIYEMRNGRLSKTNAKWDEDMESYILKTNTLGSYVISDEPLRSSTGSTDDNTDDENDNNDGSGVNPDTGMNDVVGVAAALAVVSIASAAALALKK